MFKYVKAVRKYNQTMLANEEQSFRNRMQKTKALQVKY